MFCPSVSVIRSLKDEEENLGNDDHLEFITSDEELTRILVHLKFNLVSFKEKEISDIEVHITYFKE